MSFATVRVYFSRNRLSRACFDFLANLFRFFVLALLSFFIFSVVAHFIVFLLRGIVDG